MKTVTFFLLMFALTCSSGFAQKHEVGGGVFFATENNTTEGGTGLYGYFEYLTSITISLRTTMGYYATDTKMDFLSVGDYSMLYIEESLIIRGTNPKVVPYAGLGIGYYILDHDASQAIKDAFREIYNVRIQEDIGNNVGLNFKGGIKINISPKVWFSGNLNYILLKPTLSAKATNLYSYETITIDERDELNTLLINFGITLVL